MKHGQARAFPAFSHLTAAGGSTALDRWVLTRIHDTVAGAAVRFILWDGFEIPSTRGPQAGTIVFRNRRALFSWLWDPDLNFGEAFMFGAVDIQGDLVTVLSEIYRALGRMSSRRLWPWERSNDDRTARGNVHRHYDLGNEFYSRWLDREMVYTCAYFPTPDATLEAAQVEKMDRVCRKLDLRSGDRVVEAGCGWGALALFMARRYCVTVRAFNLSTEQVEYAKARARREGLAGSVEFIEDDYRNISGTYDAFVSVGMLEHVGLADFPTIGRVIDRSLTDRGRGLLHFIGRNQPGRLNPWIQKRIFPGAYPPTLSEVVERVLEPWNQSVRDVENLRLHYAVTLRHWRQRFEASADRIAEAYDETFVRAWRLYLSGSEAAFVTGVMQLFQVVFARGATNDQPFTRAC